MRFRRRRASSMQDAFDGLCELDAARLRAFLARGESNSSPAGAMTPTTDSVIRSTDALPGKRGRRA